MKRFAICIIIVTLLLSTGFAATLPYTQTFDTTPGFNGTGLPAEWFAASNATVNSLGVSGLPLVFFTGQTQGDSYNMTNRVGVLISGSYPTDKMGYAFTNLDTRTYGAVKVNWDGVLVKDVATRSNSWTLSYRVGESATFVDVGPVFNSGNVAQGGSQTIVAPLPLDAGNKEVVQLRWIAKDVAGSGSRDAIAIDNISLEGKVAAPFINVTNTNFSVTMATTSVAMSGSNNTEVVGTVTARNILNGASATTAAGNPWWEITGITINHGVNQIYVSGTNEWGLAAVSETVTVTSVTLPFYDGFNYTVGTALDVNGWEYSGSAPKIPVAGGNLAVPGLAPPAGNMCMMTNYVVGQGLGMMSKYYDAPTSGYLYHSFAFSIQDISALFPSGSGFTGFYAMGLNTDYTLVGLQPNSSIPANYNLGIAGDKTLLYGAAAWDTNGGNGYKVGTTNFIVLRVDCTNVSVTTAPAGSFVAWVNPAPATFGGADPGSPTLSSSHRMSSAGGGTQYIYKVCYATRTGAKILADEVRVGTTWADVTPPAASGATTSYVASVTVPATNTVPNASDLTVVTNLVGTGTLTKTGAGTLRIIGSIVPGASPGTLTITNAAGTVALGQSGQPVLLSIEVAGNGGGAGTDYDYLELLGFGSAVDLARMALTVTNAQAGSQTNWFLTSTSGLANQFASSNIVLGSMNGFGIAYEASRVGIWFVPEPALLLVALLALLPLRARW